MVFGFLNPAHPLTLFYHPLIEEVELMARLGFASLSLGDHHVTASVESAGSIRTPVGCTSAQGMPPMLTRSVFA